MQVLAVSFGRNGGNCDIVCKKALLGAKAAGCDIRFINTSNLILERCNMCGGCFNPNEPFSLCVRPDDFRFVRDAIIEADGCIFAAPVYTVGVTGAYKNLLDRMGFSHDRAQVTAINDRLLAEGKPGLDPNLFKDRPVAYIPIGGARTPGWTSMGLPMMHLMGISNQMVPVDYLEGYGMGDRANPLFDQAYMDRVFQLGRNVGEQVGKKPEEMEWRGDWEGVCPCCHGTTLTYRGEGTSVECTVCGSIGKLEIVDGKIKINYPAEQIARSRYRIGGLIEHQQETNSIQGVAMKVMQERGGELPELQKELDEIVSDKPEKRTIIKKV